MPAKAKGKTSEKAKAKIPEKPKTKEITFVCKFCEKNRPLSDMVVLRHFYPQVTACKECAKDKRSSESAPPI
jgi:transcription elongation factor Elf1